MNLKIIQLYVEFGDGLITFTDDDYIEFDEVTKYTIEELEAILTEAKAFREYRKSRMPDNKHEESKKCYCGLSLVYSKEMLIDSLHNGGLDNRIDDRKIIPAVKWSHGGKYEPFNPEQTLIPKVPVVDNDIKEVIQVNEAHDNKPQALIEVPAFTDNTLDCTHHKCKNSQYWITPDGRIKIDPPEPYNVAIYTTVAEIQRLRAMDGKELQVVMRAYEKQTYANKRYALRAFLRDIAGDYFPSIPSDYVTPTVTPEPGDDSDDTPTPIAEEHKPEVTPTPNPVDPYVLKTKMSRKTAALWDKFADPAKVKT